MYTSDHFQFDFVRLTAICSLEQSDVNSGDLEVVGEGHGSNTSEAGEVLRSRSWRDFVRDGDFLHVALVSHDVQALDDASIRVVCRGKIHADCCGVAVDLKWSGGSRPQVLCRVRADRLRVDVDFGGG